MYIYIQQYIYTTAACYISIFSCSRSEKYFLYFVYSIGKLAHILSVVQICQPDFIVKGEDRKIINPHFFPPIKKNMTNITVNKTIICISYDNNGYKLHSFLYESIYSVPYSMPYRVFRLRMNRKGLMDTMSSYDIAYKKNIIFAFLPT